jgi:hypothetical protein
MVNVVDQHYPKYYAELSGSDISDEEFEKKIINAYKKIMQKQGVAAGVNVDPQEIANKLTSGKNLDKLNAMAHDSTIYNALDRYFDKHGIPESIYNRVAAIVFKKLDDHGRRLSTDPRLQGVAEGQLNELDMWAPVTTFIKMTDGSYVQADWRRHQFKTGLDTAASFINFKPVNPTVVKQLGLDSHQRNKSVSGYRSGSIASGGDYQQSGPMSSRRYDVVDYNKPETMEELPDEIKPELIKWIQKQGVAEDEINTSRMNKQHQDFYNKNPNFKRDDREVKSVGGRLATKVNPANKPAQVAKKPMTPFEGKIDFAKNLQGKVDKHNKAVVKTKKAVGSRVADIGAGGKEHNEKTDAAWDAAKKKVSEGAKVDRMVKHVEKSEEKAGKSKKDAENIAWATANKRGMLDNKNKKK